MKKILLLLLASVFLFSLVSATELVFQQGQLIDLKVPCSNAGYYCSAAAKCNLSTFYPNGTILINNLQMTNQISFHNYSISDTRLLGNYRNIVMCKDGNVNGTQTFNYLVNARGDFSVLYRTSSNFYMLLLFIGLAIIFLILAYVLDSNTLGFMAGLLFSIGGVFMMIYGINDIVDMYTRTLAAVNIGLGLYFIISTGYRFTHEDTYKGF